MLDHHVISTALETFSKFLPKPAVSALLFGGEIRDEHKTKYVFKEMTDRYKDSIKAFNRALSLNIGFAAIALYAYLVLPPTGTVQIPFVGLSVSRQIWINLVPVVAFCLQILNFTAFVWFMLLRLGLKILIKTAVNQDDYGDITNIVLSGSLGHIWIVFRIGQFFRSSWNYLWYVPAIILILSVIISPLLICLYFIIQLYTAGNLWLGLTYSFFFIPCSILFILLIGTASILGVGEPYLRWEGEMTHEINARIELIEKLAPLIATDTTPEEKAETNLPGDKKSSGNVIL